MLWSCPLVSNLLDMIKVLDNRTSALCLDSSILSNELSDCHLVPFIHLLVLFNQPSQLLSLLSIQSRHLMCSLLPDLLSHLVPFSLKLLHLRVKPTSFEVNQLRHLLIKSSSRPFKLLLEFAASLG